MYYITIICTAHKEIGKCNSIELCKIIEEFSPEIIFEELSAAVYYDCYGIMNRFTLETSAIKMYMQNHKIDHIPVVGSELSNDLDKKYEVMTKYGDYRNLLDNLMSLEATYGFQFLNSVQCEELFKKIRTLENVILENNNDVDLFRISQLGEKTVDSYENEIIENVYSYSRKNKYKKALMFIGAAHRKSIKQKIQEYEKNENFKLNWTFFNEM